MSVERGDCRAVTIPCGMCVGCRMERAQSWAVRCMHEARMHEYSSFVTLTYSDEKLPFRHALVYRDFQLFIHRLRKRLGKPVRFYMSGEYGERTGRPHFHACLFGVFFPDREYYRKSGSGSRLYKSAFLDSVWGLGLCSIGDVTFESACYTARYICKKVTGDMAEDHYRRVDGDTGEVYFLPPEFSRMSLKPGIGATWFAKFQDDVLPRDYVVVDGRKVKVPRYYMELYKRSGDLEVDSVEFDRYVKAQAPERVLDSTPERLEVRERVERARLSFKRRGLE